MPLKILPPEYQLLFWAMGVIITALLALVVYFLLRFISKRDEKDARILKRMLEHENTAQGHNCKIQKLASEIQKSASKMEGSALQFQRQINCDLSKIRKEITDIHGICLEAKAAANSVAEQLIATKDELQELYDVVEENSSGLKETKSEVKKLGQSLVMVKNKNL